MHVLTAERRSAARSQVRLPLLMDGQRCSLLQLSPRGLLLQSAVAPAVGATVQLELRYETEDGLRESMALAGDVVRVQVHADAFRVAVHLHEPAY
jgi:hypothetical protein